MNLENRLGFTHFVANYTILRRDGKGSLLFRDEEFKGKVKRVLNKRRNADENTISEIGDVAFASELAIDIRNFLEGEEGFYIARDIITLPPFENAALYKKLGLLAAFSSALSTQIGSVVGVPTLIAIFGITGHHLYKHHNDELVERLEIPITDFYERFERYSQLKVA